ncbi:hypothetical protein NKI82_08775 [Mesorhizobium sp. M0482]|uniref:hypothetical protein n=1 Tax=Mesorhizobium sp. M0482 TaxID=2956948 RepID=UPI0033356504
MAYTNLGKVDPSIVLTWAMATMHFGMGGPAPDRVVQPPADLIAKMENNTVFRDMGDEAVTHFATQGDGNRFLYVGTLSSTGDTVIVTHHSSRKPGAILQRQGRPVRTAERLQECRRGAAPDCALRSRYHQRHHPTLRQHHGRRGLPAVAPEEEIELNQHNLKGA